MNRPGNTLNSLSLLTVKNGKTSKKGKKKNRVEVLSDQSVIEVISKKKDTVQKPHESHLTQASSKKDKINLRMHSELENFDFSNFEASSNVEKESQQNHTFREEEDLELNRLKAQLSLQANKDNCSDSEEVIVIKKKKKGKKAKSKTKLNAKTKRPPESNDLLRAQSTDV